MRLTDEELTARKRRNLWIALGLLAFIVLVFTTTFLRLKQNVEERTALEAAVVEAGPPLPEE